MASMFLGRFVFAHAAVLATGVGVLLAACGSSESGAGAPPSDPSDAGGCLGDLCGDGATDDAKSNGPPPRPDDGIKNGDESDVDCGGTVAPKCALGKGCAKHEDCTTDACAYNGKCVARASCTGHHGGDTCGPISAQGDCCESLEVGRPDGQGGAYTLDKYLVTAGRMRAFVERTNGDIRGWIQGHRPDWFDENWDQYLPTTLDDPEDGNTGFNGVYQQLGAWKLISVGGQENGNRGCNVEGPGARTYWVPDEINNRWDDRQRYSKDDLDEKALNCVTQVMLAAFCAWDGGRLPTAAEISYAWSGGEGRTYPWGNSPAAKAYGSNAYSSAEEAGAPPAASKYANHEYNWWSPAQRIDSDYTVYIAPPGRFPDGNGKFGHSDLVGTVIEWTSERQSDTAAKTVKSGSWEVAHTPSNTTENRNPLVKYYAIGGRCAR